MTAVNRAKPAAIAARRARWMFCIFGSEGGMQPTCGVRVAFARTEAWMSHVREAVQENSMMFALVTLLRLGASAPADLHKAVSAWFTLRRPPEGPQSDIPS